jgi:hypothetical protein
MGVVMKGNTGMIKERGEEKKVKFEGRTLNLTVTLRVST